MSRRLNVLRALSLAAAVLFAVAWIAGCKDSVTPIKTLLDDPSRYNNQSVRIAGDVKSAVGVAGYGAYRVDDGTGSLLVLASGGGVPREGARVGVQGTFRSAFTLGTESGAVLMEARRFEP